MELNLWSILWSYGEGDETMIMNNDKSPRINLVLCRRHVLAWAISKKTLGLIDLEKSYHQVPIEAT